MPAIICLYDYTNDVVRSRSRNDSLYLNINLVIYSIRLAVIHSAYKM